MGAAPSRELGSIAPLPVGKLADRYDSIAKEKIPIPIVKKEFPALFESDPGTEWSHGSLIVNKDGSFLVKTYATEVAPQIAYVALTELNDAGDAVITKILDPYAPPKVLPVYGQYVLMDDEGIPIMSYVIKILSIR